MSAISALGGRLTIHIADVFAALDMMAADSVDCVVTSPPYWGLRDYGVEGQIGMEPTLGEHLDVMVAVFREIRRVLKPTGTVWLNYGDCYATSIAGLDAASTKAAGHDDRTFRDKPFSTIGPIRSGGPVLKNKDLCMIPNRLAIALQDDGWWVRSEIVWGKPNPMPDSRGVSRPATAHEKIFMLTKSDIGNVWRARDTGELSFDPDLSERAPLITRPDVTAARWQRNGAYYDSEAVRVRRAGAEDANGYRGGSYVHGQQGPRKKTGNITHQYVHEVGGTGTDQGHKDKPRGHRSRHAGFNARWDKMSKHQQQENGRLLRNYEPAPLAVWEFATVPFKEAHFATFPPELAARCIKAGCPHGGLVLDPFGGAGTTALVALRLGRRAILSELNEEYAQIAQRRILSEWKAGGPKETLPAGPLFSENTG